MRPKLIICIILAMLVNVLICSAAWSQDEWPMFRQNLLRTGLVDTLAHDVLGSNRPAPIWIFPVPEDEFDAVDNTDYRLPGVLTLQWFETSGSWSNAAIGAIGPYGWDYLWTAADGGGGNRARWTYEFSSDNLRALSASFRIYVLFPTQGPLEDLPHVRDAHYTVSINGGVMGRYVVDQRDGGSWIDLAGRPFTVEHTDILTIELSNLSEDLDAAGDLVESYVIADAVKIEQETGAVLSSPVVSDTSPVVVSCVVETMPLEVSGDVGSRKLGVIYGLGTEADSGIPGAGDDRGIVKWRYPAEDYNWIERGISSSPAIADGIAVVPAGDGQVYAVDTVWDGIADLIWQGPGYINPDPGSLESGSESWVRGTHIGYQRNPLDSTETYWHARAVQAGSSESPSKATWTRTITPAVDRWYAIYAWIPPSRSWDAYVSDARYEIEVDAAGTTTTNVRVDQRNGGGWVRLGTKYRIPSSGGTVTVTLTNETSGDTTDMWVAADALKIVPADLGAFEFSSPALETGLGYIDMYVGSTSGRVYKLRAGDPEPVWTYPAPDEQPIGPVYASPALSGGVLYVGSADGHVYALNANTGALNWVYPEVSTGSDQPILSFAQISSTAAVGNYIYVGIGGWGGSGFDFAPEGRIVALGDTGDAAELRWAYPDPDEDSLGVGAFVYASPLLMTRQSGEDPSIFLGSTDGYLYAVDSLGDPATQTTTELWDRLDLGDTVNSSAAGTFADYPYPPDATGASPPRLDFDPMAFVGTSGDRIYGIDLTTGEKDWWYDLLGAARSSPAVCGGRIYIGDAGGFTWAFSTLGEAWNTGVGIAAPPSTGSDGGDEPGSETRQASPDIDVFEKGAVGQGGYLDMVDRMKKSRAGGDRMSQDLHPFAKPRPGAGGAFQHEWGEDIYIIVWGLLDPNTKSTNPDEHRKPGEDDFTPTPPAGHKVQITIKSRDPGTNADSSTTVTLTGKQLIYFVTDELGEDGEEGWACFCATYVHTLDGSSSRRPQTPGTQITVSVKEVPVRPDKSSEDIPILESPGDATSELQYFTINNPLGLVYSGPYGSPVAVGVQGVLPNITTRRELAPEEVGNGNDFLVPNVWGGYTSHNTPAEPRPVGICDRSLLGAVGRKITRFRLERHDLQWTGDIDRVVNFIPAWELAPQDSRLNRPNISEDYPDISLREVSCLMQAGGQDPSQGHVELTPVQGLTEPPPANTPWPVGVNGVNVAISVPRFQPANLPDNFGGVPSETDLSNSGYAGPVYAYVDSNHNGVFDRPAGLGIAAALRRRSSRGAEAYRVLRTQVHVPVDTRAQIEERRINLGEVPHGFGFTVGTVGTDGIPEIFFSELNYDGSWTRLSPPGFGQWFRTFTARNIGNTNLLNVGLLRSGLASDTVQYPFVDFNDPNLRTALPGSGYYIPRTCVVSTLDTGEGYYGLPTLGAGFLASVPPVATPPALPANQRTFHKPRVGEGPTELRVPDVPLRVLPMFAPGITIPQGPQLPAFGVAMPLGQPVGTYYGRMQLAENGQPVSNALGIVISTAEARLTDGSTLAPPEVHPPHLDVADPNGTATGDAMPAAYRDRVTGNIHLFWSSSRYGSEITGSGVGPAASDPWYLYMSTLETQAPSYAPGSWRLSSVVPTQWWSPTTSGTIFPPPGSVGDYFPAPTAGDPKRGAPGIIIPGSVKFASPSVAVDQVTGKAWLLFSGQAYKHNDDASIPPDQRRNLESRTYYTEVTGGDLDPAEVYSTSPNPTSDPIRGEWTTPKFGVRGGVIRRTNGAKSELWCFWYGGNKDRWRIYYNVNPDPSDRTKWTNEAHLPIPKGLSSAAEPSPVVREWDGRTGDTFDVVYTAYSAFHKNSDIYLSRYKSAAGPVALAKGGHWPVELQVLPERTTPIPEVTLGGQPLLGEKLTRDPTRGVWYSRDIDWNSRIVSFADNPNPSFRVYVCGDPDPDSVYEVNIGSWTKDSTTGGIAFTYGDNTPECVTLRAKFRAVVINPVEGTVKFLKPPASKAMVVAKYRPRAYRLTSDSGADAFPCAVLDDDRNPRWSPGNPSGNPFFLPSANWDPDFGPPTDRLWVFWRRPGSDKTGAGGAYKTYRYVVDLNNPREKFDADGNPYYARYQVALDSSTRAPAISEIESVIPDPGSAIEHPVEIDWVRNRLYFTSSDALAGSVDIPALNRVKVTYVDDTGTVHDSYNEYDIQFVEEEMGQAGKTFGNLSSLVVNESQVNAFKDPSDNKVWVFWTSTRSGNADLYYEAVSPLFYGVEVEHKPSP